MAVSVDSVNCCMSSLSAHLSDPCDGIIGVSPVHAFRIWHLGPLIFVFFPRHLHSDYMMLQVLRVDLRYRLTIHDLIMMFDTPRNHDRLDCYWRVHFIRS